MIHETLGKAAHVDKRDILAEHHFLIEWTLKEIHIKHKQDLKNISLGLLIVIAPRKFNSIPILYRTERSTLVPEGEYAAHGSGKSLSDYFADRLYKHGQHDEYLAVLASFIFREAEKSVSGIGLGNDMVFIYPNGLRKELHTESISEIQAGIPSLADAIQSYWAEHLKPPPWLKDYAAADESTT
jgi:hypothetical protein